MIIRRHVLDNLDYQDIQHFLNSSFSVFFLGLSFLYVLNVQLYTFIIYYSIWYQRLKLYINIMRQQNNLKCLDGNKNGIQYTPPLSRKLIIMQIILVTQHIQCSECFQCSINDTQQVTSSSNTSCSTDCCQRIDRSFQRVLSEHTKISIFKSFGNLQGNIFRL